MLVVNRFLFSITTVDRNRNVYFYEDKWERMKAAQRYFTVWAMITNSDVDLKDFVII